MEIETKIFDTKKVRKVLKRLKIEPKSTIDVMDYFFDLRDFSTKNWRYLHPRGSHSGLLGIHGFSVEIPDTSAL